MMTNEVYLLLGTNLGDRLTNLTTVLDHLRRTIGKISKLSQIYETAAWGKEDQNSFYNQVVRLETALGPRELLEKLQAIESTMGRVRYEKWGTRIIDIDILFYGNEIVTLPDLKIPHPEIQNRRFTLEPLVEIAPDLVHPALDKKVEELLAVCPDKLAVATLSKPA